MKKKKEVENLVGLWTLPNILVQGYPWATIGYKSNLFWDSSLT